MTLTRYGIQLGKSTALYISDEPEQVNEVAIVRTQLHVPLKLDCLVAY